MNHPRLHSGMRRYQLESTASTKRKDSQKWKATSLNVSLNDEMLAVTIHVCVIAVAVDKSLFYY